MVFLGNEFLYLDYTQDTWALGDVTTADGYQLEIAENSSITKLDAKECSHSNVLVTGGVCKSGAILNWAYGVNFEKDSKGQVVA